MSKRPAIHALFQKRFEGDDTLLELAHLKFAEAGMGAEVYATSSEELEDLLRHVPETGPLPLVHLSRKTDITREEWRARISGMAGRFAGRVAGFVTHDQEDAHRDPDGYADALFILNSLIARTTGDNGPMVYIEYAVGLAPPEFIDIFLRIQSAEHISACIDIGHLGLYFIRAEYKARHPGVDICSFSPHSPGLSNVIDDVEGAMSSALPKVIETIEALVDIGKPLHFHLHDAHPLYDWSTHDLSDHLSFFEAIQLPFRTEASLPLYGPAGLVQIVKAALRAPELSLSIEIHPCGDRLPLDIRSRTLFEHWTNTENAECMNHWLMCLVRNFCLLKQIVDESV